MHESVLEQYGRAQSGVVARPQLLHAGVPRTSVDRWLTTGRIEPILPGVYRVAGTPSTWEQRVVAATLATDGIASHRTAARVWELADYDVIEVTTGARGRRIGGVTVHRLDAVIKASLRNGIRVTNPLDTLVLLGGVVPRADVEAAFHEALVQKLLTIKAAQQTLTRLARPGRRGPSVLRAILDDWELGLRPPDSVLEIRFPAVLAAHGLPRAVFQHWVNLGRGRRARLDFAYPDLKIAMEIEGRERHDLPLDREADALRRNRLTALGWRVLVFTWGRVVKDPAGVAADVADQLAASRAS